MMQWYIMESTQGHSPQPVEVECSSRCIFRFWAIRVMPEKIRQLKRRILKVLIVLCLKKNSRYKYKPNFWESQVLFLPLSLAFRDFYRIFNLGIQTLEVMKKKGLLLIIIAGMLANVTLALDLSFSKKENGVWKTVPNGGTITFSCIKSGIIDEYLGVKNNTTANICIAMCKSYAVKSPKPFVDEFCWDRCYPQQITKSDGCLPFKPGMEDNLHFHLAYTPKGESGETVIKYTFWTDGTSGDSAFIVVHFVSSTTGINNEANPPIASVSPNPCRDVAVFTFENCNQAGRIIISDILGNRLSSLEIFPGQKELRTDLSFLPDGVYLYQTEIAGIIGRAKKLVIRK